MQAKPLFAHLGRSAIGAALVFAMSSGSATPTSLEFAGLLLDDSGNRITAQPYMIFSSVIYDGPTTNTLPLQLGAEHVQVQNGSFLQMFSSIDDPCCSTRRPTCA